MSMLYSESGSLSRASAGSYPGNGQSGLQRSPTVFVAHGSGPSFLLKPIEPLSFWDRLTTCLSKMRQELVAQPKAILIISGHWEEDVPTIYGPKKTTLIYDCFDSPSSAYEFQYPVEGDPELVVEIGNLLAGAGIPYAFNSQRGFDHGAFIPLTLAFPNANVPVVQLSLQSNLDPVIHLNIGKALTPLREKNVLIMGSGMSYHNLTAFGAALGNQDAEQFDIWLNAVVTNCDPISRNTRLRNWISAPGALAAHPRAEHIAPLFVAAGAAGQDIGQRNYQDTVFGKALSGFIFAASDEHPK